MGIVNNDAFVYTLIEDRTMQLSYRGAHYEAHFEDVHAESTEKIGKYRGAPITGKSYRLEPHPHQRVQLTYRGQRYTRDV